ncbi:MAG: fasciclin domain-containing protein [Prevotella sp.]|nr:fasciclin domain-containing protein [Prevotella sp.]
MKILDNYKTILRKLSLLALVPAMIGLVGCKEDIDESNLYTFTGETIEDYLNNRSDEFSSFNYILSRVGYDKILSAYGMYTCFAPTNAAVNDYINELYDDADADLPHNGMTSKSLEGLTDSLCNDIALFHLASTEVMAVDMTNGMTINTMLGRDINAAIDSVSGNTVLNSSAMITSMDNELENGVLHVVDKVIRRSNRMVAGELALHEEFKLFSQALEVTKLADSLSALVRTGIEPVTDNTAKWYVPEECKVGFTLFAESDDVFKANGINDISDLANYAAEIYGKCADPSSGWYDYYRNNKITVDTSNDYTKPNNCLNMFVRYHILKLRASYDKLLYSFNEVSKVSLVEYYETMLPYTLMKVMRISGKRLLNRWVTNTSLTDRIAELGTAGMQTVMRNGIEIKNTNIQALNGYIHPVTDMLVYDYDVPHGVLNERMRFDDTAFLWEMMSNSHRGATYAEIKAWNGGVSGSEGSLSGDYIRYPANFFENMRVYNGNNTHVMYLSGSGNGWSNYQGDEFNCMGAYDFAFRLPPVPDGTYELRLGYTANSSRGMVQFYLGRSSALTSMKALDIPLDMRRVPVDNPDGSPDNNSGTGWCLYTKTDDMGVESDANMHNLGWMRGPLYYTVGKGGSLARANAQDLRRIVAKMQFEQGEYWLRFKTVLPDNRTTQFHLDYIEFCPENVYNNNQYVEDMY